MTPNAALILRCHHCGQPDEVDGDHSCPCPHTDDECRDHPALCPPCHALRGPNDYFLCPMREGVVRSCQDCGRRGVSYLCRGVEAHALAR